MTGVVLCRRILRGWTHLGRRSWCGRLVKPPGSNARGLSAGTHYFLKVGVIYTNIPWLIPQYSMFLNSMVAGTPKNQAEALGGLRPFNYVIDIPAGTADIPGDGKTPVKYTSTQDVGRFVAGSLDLEHWEPVSGMAGDNKTYDEVVEIAERVTGGKRKLLRRYTSAEEFRKKAEETTDLFQRFRYQVSWSNTTQISTFAGF